MTRRVLLLVLLAAAGCGEGVSVDRIQLSLSPLSGRQGQTLTLFVQGVGTSFSESDPDVPGSATDPRVAVAGAAHGVVLGQVIVDNDHRARIPVYISTTAEPTADDGSGKRIISVSTAGFSRDFEFSVDPSPSLPGIHIEPDSGVAGTSAVTVDVLALDASMSFGEDTVVTFTDDSGVHVDEAQVTGPSHVRLRVHIDDDAPQSTSSVTVTSGGDVAVHPFEVHAQPDTRLWVFPPEAPRGTTATLNLVVEGLTLSEEDLAVRFPFNPGVHVESVTWASAGSASTVVTIDEDAPVGIWQIVVSSGGSEASSNFRVLPTTNSEPFLRLFPAVIERGATYRDVFVTGVYTHLAMGESSLDIVPGEGITVEGFWVLDEAGQQAVARISVARDAGAGPSVLTVTTGEEAASGVLTVIEPPDLVVRLDPSAATQGDATLRVGVEVEGADLLGGADMALQFASGSGIAATDLVADTATTGHVTVDVGRSAPTGSSLVTLSIDGARATAPFAVLPAPGAPRFTLSPPYLSIPSGDVVVTLDGTGTTWVDTETVLVLSDPSIEVKDLVVTGPTTATATVAGPAWVSSRRVVAYMASPSGIEAGWWTMLLPGHRALTAYPDVVQAGESRTLLVVGGDTTFVNGLTTAVVPPSVDLRVGSVTVYDPDLATVSIESSADTPTGIYALTLTTGGETALGTLRVTAGALPAAEADPGSVPVETATTVRLVAPTPGFDAHTTVTAGAAGLPGLVLGVPTVVDPSTVDVDVYAYGSLLGMVVPLEIATDLEVLRGCVALVGDADAPFAHFSPLAVRPDVSRTITVTAMGSPPVDFEIDEPVVEAASTGVTVAEVRVVDGVTLEVDVQVGDEATITDSAVRLRIATTRFAWTLVVPVLDTPPSVSITSNPSLSLGTVRGTLELSSKGFGMADGSLRVAAPSPVLFVDSVTGTGPTGAAIVYDTATRETDMQATLFVLPEATPWAVPLVMDLSRAGVRVVGTPSTVMETIPPDGPDLVRFTPAEDASLLVHSVVDGSTHAPAWVMLGSDGISVTARVSGDDLVLLPDTTSTRHYVRTGDASTLGMPYWLSLGPSLAGIDRMEAEPNDSTGSARGLPAPGGAASLLLARIDCDCDVDYFELPVGPPTCYEILATRMSGGTFSSPFVTLTLLDAAGSPLRTATGGLGHMDPMICTTGSGTARYLRVESEAGTTGPYVIQPRWPVMISELDHRPFTGPWVEIQGPAGHDVSGWTLEILDGSSGASRGSVSLASLGTLPADGLALLASPSAAVTPDLASAVLDQMIPPYAVLLCHSSLGTCDRVQVGGTGLFGEGSPLDPALVPAGRTWNLDTGRNDQDLVPMMAGTPGASGGLPVP